jgi:acyl-CoA reductase-like NAD-dependent aldehyde dehydrogenase
MATTTDHELGIAKAFIDGGWRERTSLGSIDPVNPATGRVNGTVAMSGAAEVDAAVAAAKAAQAAWRAMPGDQRRPILQRIDERIQKELESLGRTTTLELGHPLYSSIGLSWLCSSWFGYYAGWCDKIEGSTVPLTGANTGFDYTSLEPYGVVGIVLTWNGPMVSVGMKVAPALAAGNCVVLKTPEQAPYSVGRFVEIALEAGLPSGVLQVLPGGGEAGDRLVRHPDVRKISFTGGIPTARKIMAAASENLTPLVFELGGKSANVVFADADLEAAVNRTVSSCYTLAGQGCVISTRLLAERSIYDQVVAAASRKAASLVVGDPFAKETVVGPVVSKDAYQRILGVLDDARSRGGARIVTGGSAVDRASLPAENAGGFFIQPTVLADVPPESSLAQQEVFGPVMSIIPFETEDEAVAIANGTSYGLGTFLHTRDVSRVHRLVPRFESGTVSVNGVSALPPAAPFGGYKQSGFGREGGRDGLMEFLQVKNVHIHF